MTSLLLFHIAFIVSAAALVISLGITYLMISGRLTEDSPNQQQNRAANETSQKRRRPSSQHFSPSKCMPGRTVLIPEFWQLPTSTEHAK